MLDQSVTHDHAASDHQAPVVISLFDTFDLTVNGAVGTSFRSNKTHALLVYLLLAHPQPILRATLRDLLWADYAAPSAQTSLRQTLTNLRDCLAPFDLIQSSRSQISLTRDPARLWCDVHQFEALLDACHHHDHRSLPHNNAHRNCFCSPIRLRPSYLYQSTQ